MQLDGDFVRPQRVDLPEALVEVELARQLMVDPEPVAAPMRRLVEAGGKRLRPRLVQLTAGIGPRNDPLHYESCEGCGRIFIEPGEDAPVDLKSARALQVAFFRAFQAKRSASK